MQTFRLDFLAIQRSGPATNLPSPSGAIAAVGICSSVTVTCRRSDWSSSRIGGTITSGGYGTMIMSRTGNSRNEDQEKSVEIQSRPEGGGQSRDLFKARPTDRVG